MNVDPEARLFACFVISQNAGLIVLSPFQFVLIALTPISAASFKILNATSFAMMPFVNGNFSLLSSA
jgi:hypothetical protein